MEQVFAVILEGMSNTWRHGRARSAVIKVCEAGAVVRITIDDDGVGFPKIQCSALGDRFAGR